MQIAYDGRFANGKALHDCCLFSNPMTILQWTKVLYVN